MQRKLKFISFILCALVFIFAVDFGMSKFLSHLLQGRADLQQLLPNAYLTASMTILTMSAITFGLFQGMTQIMTNKLKYKTISKFIKKDNTPMSIFIVFSTLNFALLSIYFYGDFTENHITYVSILLNTMIIVVIGIIYLYYHGLSRYDTISVLNDKKLEVLNGYKIHHKDTVKIIGKINKLNKETLKNKKRGSVDKKISKKLEELQYKLGDYEKLMTEILDDYSYVRALALRDNDSELYRFILKSLSEIAVDRIKNFESIDSNFLFIATVEGDKQLINTYKHWSFPDDFIEKRILPQYYNNLQYANLEVVRHSNNILIELIIDTIQIEYSDRKYAVMIKCVLDAYIDSLIVQVELGYKDAYKDLMCLIQEIIDLRDFHHKDVVYEYLPIVIERAKEVVVFKDSHLRRIDYAILKNHNAKEINKV